MALAPVAACPGQIIFNPYLYTAAPPPPAGPASIAAGAENASQIASGFRFQTSTNGTAWATNGTLGSLAIESPLNLTAAGYAANTHLYARWVAWNSFGESVVATPAEVYTAPANPPTGLTATVLSDTEVRLNWTAPGATPINGGYQAAWSTNAGTTWTKSNAIVPVGTNLFVVDGLTGSTPHLFKVRSVNTSPNADDPAGSPYSGTASATTNETILTYDEYSESLGGLIQKYTMGDTSSNATEEFGRSGGNYNGTYTLGQAGIPGSASTAALFAGSGRLSSGSTGNTSALALINNSSAFTASAWVKLPPSATQTGDTILSFGTASIERGPVTRISSSNASLPSFRLFDQAGAQMVIGASSSTALLSSIGINDAAWHNVSTTWQGSIFNCYVDGLSAATSSGTTVTISTNITPTRIGGGGQANSSVGTTGLYGTMAMIEIRNTCLSQADLRKLYNKGVGLPISTP